MMGKYKETYTNLYHGTTAAAAKEIITNQKFVPSGEGSWCGAGIYFYDIKAKAFWAANRKCNEIKAQTGASHIPTVVNADILDLDRNFILDLRDPNKFGEFFKIIEPVLNECELKICSGDDTQEELIKLRGILISTYAKKYDAKLVIGHFQQREQPVYSDFILNAARVKMVIGLETIYCVKNDEIISEIRGVIQ